MFLEDLLETIFYAIKNVHISEKTFHKNRLKKYESNNYASP